MAKLLTLPAYKDERGILSVMEGQEALPFLPRRVFYIYNVPENTLRGGHGHFKTRLLLIALSSAIEINISTTEQKETFLLDSPRKALLIEPNEWHSMIFKRSEGILLVLASECYDKNDYFFEEPLL